MVVLGERFEEMRVMRVNWVLVIVGFLFVRLLKERDWRKCMYIGFWWLLTWFHLC